MLKTKVELWFFDPKTGHRVGHCSELEVDGKGMGHVSAVRAINESGQFSELIRNGVCHRPVTVLLRRIPHGEFHLVYPDQELKFSEWWNEKKQTLYLHDEAMDKMRLDMQSCWYSALSRR